MANHTVDCRWCGKDIRTIGTITVAAHEDNCKDKPMSEEKGSPPVATSDIIKSLVEVRDERQRISARDKELIDKWRSLELELLGRLDEQGMLKASTLAGTASITETVLPQVVDWDAVFEHIQETGDFYLLQKRPAAAAFRELIQAGQSVPGMEVYTKRAISLRKK